jgi:hypothetical protein
MRTATWIAFLLPALLLVLSLYLPTICFGETAAVQPSVQSSVQPAVQTDIPEARKQMIREYRERIRQAEKGKSKSSAGVFASGQKSLELQMAEIDAAEGWSPASSGELMIAKKLDILTTRCKQDRYAIGDQTMKTIQILKERHLLSDDVGGHWGFLDLMTVVTNPSRSSEAAVRQDYATIGGSASAKFDYTMICTTYIALRERGASHSSTLWNLQKMLGTY